MTRAGCAHDLIVPIDADWGRCVTCGDSTFPLSAAAAGMNDMDLPPARGSATMACKHTDVIELDVNSTAQRRVWCRTCGALGILPAGSVVLWWMWPARDLAAGLPSAAPTAPAAPPPPPADVDRDRTREALSDLVVIEAEVRELERHGRLAGGVNQLAEAVAALLGHVRDLYVHQHLPAGALPAEIDAIRRDLERPAAPRPTPTQETTRLADNEAPELAADVVTQAIVAAPAPLPPPPAPPRAHAIPTPASASTTPCALCHARDRETCGHWVGHL